MFYSSFLFQFRNNSWPTKYHQEYFYCLIYLIRYAGQFIDKIYDSWRCLSVQFTNDRLSLWMIHKRCTQATLTHTTFVRNRNNTADNLWSTDICSVLFRGLHSIILSQGLLCRLSHRGEVSTEPLTQRP